MAPPASVAVIIAAYNAAETLDQALASALAEPEVAEVCVVDDRSSDATATTAEAWAARDTRVRVIRQPVNAGPSAARNVAIAATTANWIAILDADDFFLPGRLARMLAHGGDADFVADTLIRSTSRTPPPLPAAATAEPRALSFCAFIRGNSSKPDDGLDLGFLKPIFRRAFVNQHGLRYVETMRLGEDYEFYARALALGARFLVCGPAGYISVEREGSLSKDHSAEDLRLLRDCDDGLRRIRPLSRDEDDALRRHWGIVDCRLQWRQLISAVKARNVRAALATFHSMRAAVYLSIRLAEQVWERGAAAALRRR